MSVWDGFDREVRRLGSSQSAFTIHDLLNVARAHEPHVRLQQIYEWYFRRTLTAIRSAFTAAGLVAAALYALIGDPHNAFLIGGLAFLALACALAGIVQLRQLAPLHRELAAALRLLTDVSELSAGWRRPARASQPSAPRFGLRVVVIALLLLIIVGVLWVLADPGVEAALGIVGTVAATAVFVHVVLELKPHHLQDPRWLDVLDRSQSLDDAIGRVRLDDYVLFEEVTLPVDIAICCRAKHAPGADLGECRAICRLRSRLGAPE